MFLEGKRKPKGRNNQDSPKKVSSEQTQAFYSQPAASHGPRKRRTLMPQCTKAPSWCDNIHRSAIRTAGHLAYLNMMTDYFQSFKVFRKELRFNLLLKSKYMQTK